MSDSGRPCWCEKSRLRPFSPEYHRCEHCGTLVSQVGLTSESVKVRADESDFYGKEYWLSHQTEELGLSSITERARTDMADRCPYWLRALLSYRLPPAKVLEVGCSHGGFVSLMCAAGYDAEGLEVSPWVVEQARKTFDIPMRVGPLEEQSLVPDSYDVVASFDVLEHLDDPVGTMRASVGLLKPDGILLIQTPVYPEGRSWEELRAEDSPFLRMIDATLAYQHLYVFSESSVRQLLRSLGLHYFHFTEPVFPYDMFFAAGRAPITPHAKEVADQCLAQDPERRVVLALLDTFDLLHVSEKDRAARLDVIHQLQGAVNQLRAAPSLRARIVHRLKRFLVRASA